MGRWTSWRAGLVVGLGIVSGACQTAGVNPTGLYGGQVTYADGPRQLLDCRGALQQYARDFRVDLALIKSTQTGIGAGLTAAKLAEVDAISSDLINHHYVTCTNYNAGLISREHYVARMERLQEIQLDVRRAVGNLYGPNQSIQINPAYGNLPYGQPYGAQPGQPALPPRGTATEQPVEPGAQDPTAQAPGGPSVVVRPPSVAIPGAPQNRMDQILSILRQGLQIMREQPATGRPGSRVEPASGPRVMPVASRVPAGSAGSQPAGPEPRVGADTPLASELDGQLADLLGTLKADILRRDPARAAARAVVGHLTEEGHSWSSPLGAALQEQLTTIVSRDRFFRPVVMRGVTLKEVAAVKNPSRPESLGALYGADIAISGTYAPRPEGAFLSLVAFGAAGEQLGRAARLVHLKQQFGSSVAAPGNVPATAAILDSLARVGSDQTGGPVVELLTSRPGAGAHFRLGEEIRYFVASQAEGFLYLFHLDTEGRLVRLFPNRHQPDPYFRTANILELPEPGSPYTFVATPPFGLETTVALLTAEPLTEAELRQLEWSLNANGPSRDMPARLRLRSPGTPAAQGASAGAAPSARTDPGAGVVLGWSYVTVLIRP